MTDGGEAALLQPALDLCEQGSPGIDLYELDLGMDKPHVAQVLAGAFEGQEFRALDLHS
jgi:hypothetical protein